MDLIIHVLWFWNLNVGWALYLTTKIFQLIVLPAPFPKTNVKPNHVPQQSLSLSPVTLFLFMIVPFSKSRLRSYPLFPNRELWQTFTEFPRFAFNLPTPLPLSPPRFRSICTSWCLDHTLELSHQDLPPLLILQLHFLQWLWRTEIILFFSLESFHNFYCLPSKLKFTKLKFWYTKSYLPYYLSSLLSY